MLCQHVQHTQLIQNNILEKLSVPDETENIVYYTRESRLSFNIKLYIYFSWGLSRSHHCYRHWIKRIFVRFIFVYFSRNKNFIMFCGNYNLDYLKLRFCRAHKKIRSSATVVKKFSKCANNYFISEFMIKITF